MGNKIKSEPSTEADKHQLKPISVKPNSSQARNQIAEYIDISSHLNLQSEYDAIISLMGEITAETFTRSSAIHKFFSSGKLSNSQLQNVNSCIHPECSICPLQFAVLVCTIWRIATINDIFLGDLSNLPDQQLGQKFEENFTSLSKHRSILSTTVFWKQWNLAHKLPDPILKSIMIKCTKKARATMIISRESFFHLHTSCYLQLIKTCATMMHHLTFHDIHQQPSSTIDQPVQVAEATVYQPLNPISGSVLDTTTSMSCDYKLTVNKQSVDKSIVFSSVNQTTTKVDTHVPTATSYITVCNPSTVIHTHILNPLAPEWLPMYSAPVNTTARLLYQRQSPIVSALHWAPHIRAVGNSGESHAQYVFRKLHRQLPLRRADPPTECGTNWELYESLGHGYEPPRYVLERYLRGYLLTTSEIMQILSNLQSPTSLCISFSAFCYAVGMAEWLALRTKNDVAHYTDRIYNQEKRTSLSPDAFNQLGAIEGGVNLKAIQPTDIARLMGKRIELSPQAATTILTMFKLPIPPQPPTPRLNTKPARGKQGLWDNFCRIGDGYDITYKAMSQLLDEKPGKPYSLKEQIKAFSVLQGPLYLLTFDEYVTVHAMLNWMDLTPITIPSFALLSEQAPDGCMPTNDLRRHPTIKAGLQLGAFVPETLDWIIGNLGTRVSKTELALLLHSLRFDTFGSKLSADALRRKNELKANRSRWYISQRSAPARAIPPSPSPTGAIKSSLSTPLPARGSVAPQPSHGSIADQSQPTLAPSPHSLSALGLVTVHPSYSPPHKLNPYPATTTSLQASKVSPTQSAQPSVMPYVHPPPRRPHPNSAPVPLKRSAQPIAALPKPSQAPIPPSLSASDHRVFLSPPTSAHTTTKLSRSSGLIAAMSKPRPAPIPPSPSAPGPKAIRSRKALARPRRQLILASIDRRNTSYLATMSVIVYTGPLLILTAYTYLLHTACLLIYRCLHFLPTADTVSTVRGQLT